MPRISPSQSLLLSLLFSAVAPLLAVEVKVSSFGFDPDDATAIIQKAIDSGAERLILDQVGKPWVTQPLFLRSKLDFVFEPGVKLLAKPGAFQNKRDCLLNLHGCRDVNIIGAQGAEIVMRKTDYQNPELYALGEWRYGIRAYGVKNLVLRDLAIRASGGDGICVTGLARPERDPIHPADEPYRQEIMAESIRCARNVLIENCLVDDNHRQAITVAGVRDIIIRNCVLSNTKGTPPQAGIDFEPDGTDTYCVNALVEKTTFINNAGSAIDIFVGSRHEPLSITIRDCDFTCPATAISAIGRQDSKGGSVNLENLRITMTADRPFLLLRNRWADDVAYNLKDVTVTAEKTFRKTPIFIAIDNTWKTEFGDVSFQDVTINGYAEQTPLMGMKALASPSELVNMTGTVTYNGQSIDMARFIQSPDFKVSRFQVPHYRVETFAAPVGERFPATFPPLRYQSELLIYGEAGETIGFSLRYNWVNRRMKTYRDKLKLSGPDGHVLELGDFVFNPQDKTIDPNNVSQRFTAVLPATGCYRLPLDPGFGGYVLEPDEALRWAFIGGVKSEYNTLLRPTSKDITGYFEVPAGVRDFAIEFSGGTGARAMPAVIRDEQGKTILETTLSEATAVLNLTRPDDASAVWSFTVSRPFAGLYIRLPHPLTGVWAGCPGNLPRVNPAQAGQ